MIKKSRCAIYTRKSTEEGLEQAFNSLDAQREACGAYIASQVHEGWTSVAECYDDGGWSGGNMERPALKRLLQDVATGQVDVIVVYKVDRLTRSLADFAKIVDVLDKAGASFVSVTQAFNTTNSMGRLTLNVLLSFAQFEREVTGERIRDKIAASKAKGMWMGGVVPLGYDVVDRALKVNAMEADRVRLIFEQYLALGSVASLEQALDKADVRSKVRGERGGSRFTRGALYTLLRNTLYTGQVAHKDKTYPGNHEAIVDPAIFERAQALLDHNRNNERAQGRLSHPNPLIGKIFDAAGRPMSPSHSTKGGRRYRYYVSRHVSDDASERTRLPAGDVERIVADVLTELLTNAAALMDHFDALQTAGSALQQLLAHAAALVSDRKTESVLTVTSMILQRVSVLADQIEIAVDLASLVTSLSADAIGPVLVILTRPVELTRSRKEVKLVISDKPSNTRGDPALIKLLTKAYAVRQSVERGTATVAELATAAGHNIDYYKVLLKLSYLAPGLQIAVLSGSTKPSITRQFLARVSLPHCWIDQRSVIMAV